MFDTICSVTFQSEIIIPSRIPALLGDAGSGKSYITCELFPYYMSKKIKGHLYHAVVNCATVKSGRDILFKWDSSRSNKIIVGAVGEAIIRSNECDNVDDFFLVTLDNYNGMLKRDEDKLFSFINNIGSTIAVADKIYKSIANFNIIINGCLKK